MQFFIRIVDAQLLERIEDEIFEAKYVEHAEETGGIVAWIYACVYVTDQPGECP